MIDYTWPSVYFAYFFFFLCFVLAVFFFVRSWKDGYWDKQGDDIKYQVFDEAEKMSGLHSRSKEQVHVPR